MILDDSAPRYLPHCTRPELLAMGLSPLDGGSWIEVDTSLGRFHAHKQALAASDRAAVYRWLPGSLPAQEELAEQSKRTAERQRMIASPTKTVK